MSADLLSVTVRAAAFVCLFQAAGVSFFLARFGTLVVGSRVSIARLGCATALGGALLIVLHQSLEAARMAGEFAGMADAGLQRLAWLSTGGLAHILQAVGLLLAAAGLRGAHRLFGHRSTAVALSGAFLALLAFLLTGHTSTHSWRLLLAPLLGAHLLIIAFWFGALAPLYLVLVREPLAVATWVLQAFSALAVWLVPFILIVGLGLALIMVPGMEVLRRPYGQLLAAKVAAFALLMGLAMLNRSHLIPALSDAQRSEGAVRALCRSLAAEFGLLAAVLAATAVLTTFYSPDP